MFLGYKQKIKIGIVKVKELTLAHKRKKYQQFINI